MYKRAAPGVMIDDRKRSAATRFAESRLVIHNYLGTGWLETLFLDIPTVCFFDSQAYAFRDEALPLIAELETVGILHPSGPAAAKFINNLQDNFEDWWQTAVVKTARQNFIKKYANFSTNWMNDWELQLKGVQRPVHCVQ